MGTKTPSIAISEFKATCLHLLEEVASTGKPLTITKRGRPIATVSPIAAVRTPIRGSWKGKVKVTGEIVHFNAGDDWESAQ